LLAVAAAVVVANLPYLLDFFDPNPLGPHSGLVSAITPGRLGGSPAIDPNNGYVSQALGHRAALDLLHLQLPWWNPYEGTGAPLAGEMQSAALFPPTLLTLLANGQLYEHMLLELIAGLATYLLLRRISINRWASTAAAIAFALNGTLAWFSHAPFNPVAFMPLLLLGIELAYAASLTGRSGGWWLIAVAGALSFYAGFPEVAYIDALLAVCWFAWRCGRLPRGRIGAFAAKAATGAAVGTLLSAPLLIATIDYLDHADLGLHASSFLGGLSLGTHILPQLLLPYVFGPVLDFVGPNGNLWGAGGYLSTSLLLLALLGLFSRRRRGLRLTLFVWALLVFARIYGQPPVLGHVLGLLPGMSRVVFWRYAAASLELPVIILAALGLDDLARVPEHRRRLVWAALASLALLALAVIGTRPQVHQLGPGFSHHPWVERSAAWGAAIVIAAAGAAFVRQPRVRVGLLALLLAFDAVVLFAVPEASAPRAVKLDLAPVAFLQRHLGSSRFFTLGPLQPNYGSYFGVASLDVNDLPIPAPFEHYARKHLDTVVDPTVFIGNTGGGRPVFAPSPQQELLRNLAGYRQAGVGYVLVAPGQALPQRPTTFQLVFRSPSTWIYHLAGALPYFTATNPRCRVTFQSRDSARLSCPSPTVLVRRETDLPGWSADVDGHSARVAEADGLFQAVAVGAGSHRVQFSYLPPNAGWGFLGLIAGCACLLLAAAIGRRQGGR
jgi:hypothetical protein